MSECIEWTGTRHDYGYGLLYADGKMQYVHRLTWAEANGPIPEGLKVRHSCDNPPCYNLEHLELGTQGDNMQDKVDRGRATGGHPPSTHCKEGHEFTPENTVRPPDGRRRCRTCRNARDLASYHRRRDA